MMKNKTIKIFILSIFLIFEFLSFSDMSFAAGWLDGWTYRKKITITGQVGAGTNYQVLLKIGESSGSVGYNFHLGGHSEIFPSATATSDNSGDIRFTTSDEQTLENIWVERVDGSAPNRVAYVWVKVSASLETNQDIYCYYGNSGASNVSSGANVFEFFDDFTGASLDTTKWYQKNGGAPSLANGVMTVSSNNVDPGKIIAQTAPNGNNYVLRSRFQVTAGTDTDERAGLSIKTGTSDGRGYNYVFHDFTALDERSFLNDGTAWNVRSAAWAKSTWYTEEIYHDGTNVQGRFDDGTWQSQAWSGRTGYPGLNIGSKSGTTTVWDWAAVRKIIATEPAFSSSVAEQEESTFTWYGSDSTAWSLTANWDRGIIPTATSDVVINGGYTYAPVISANVAINSLSIGETDYSILSFTTDSSATLTVSSNTNVYSNGILDLNGNSLSVSGAFTVYSGGYLRLQGGETCSTPTLNSGSTVVYNAVSGTKTIKDWTYHHLTIDGIGGTFQFGVNESLGGSFTATNGTVDFNGKTITISGNMTMAAGSQVIAGNDAMDGAVINVSGDLDLNGESGDKLTFDWTNTWSLIVSGDADMDYCSFDANSTNSMILTVSGSTATASYVDVEYSDASGGIEINAADDSNTNNGNNTNWDFGYIAEGWLSGWLYRKRIAISNTNVDAQLSNFPLYVKINNDSDLSKALSNGYDIRFTSSDGETLLKYERESWSGGGGSAAAANFWVKVPTVATSDSTYIYTYYGKADASDGQDPENVWDSSFEAVYHLNETGSNPSVYDSTANSNDSTTNTWTPTASSKINGGGTFNDASTEEIQVSNFSANVSNISTLTFEIWMKGGNTPMVNAGAIAIRNSDAASCFYISQINYEASVEARFRNSSGTAFTLTAVPDLDNWTHAAFVLNGSDLMLYINGALAASTDGASGVLNSATLPLRIGSMYVYADRYWDGELDEPRVSTTNRSAEWIKFEYYNMSSANNELTFGAENGAEPTFTQVHFKIYQDNGGLNSAAQYAKEDSNFNVGPNAAFRIRFEVSNTGSSGDITRRLEFKEDSGSWTQITTSSNNVRLYDSPNFNDTDATTSRLTAVGTFTAGQGKDSGSDTTQISLGANYYVEDEWSLKFQSQAAGHSYQFRVSNAGSALDSYDKTPSISPNAASGYTSTNVGTGIRTGNGIRFR